MSDYYSKFPFVRRLPAKCTSAAVVLQLKQIFSEQGILQIVRTDNGPQFNSKEFSEFSSVYGFKHVTSSPHYPRSNGFIESQVKIVKRTFIESQVKIVKRTLEKVAKDNSDPHLALLYVQSTPSTASYRRQLNCCSTGLSWTLFQRFRLREMTTFSHAWRIVSTSRSHRTTNMRKPWSR